MRNLSDKAKNAFLVLLSTLSSEMGENRVKELAALLHPACNGFGTSPHEVFKGRENWLSLFREEIVQIPNGIRAKMKWCETFVIDHSSVGLMAETIFEINTPKDKLVFDPLRMTIIFTMEGDTCLVRHWHVSYPLGEVVDEIFPGSKEPTLYQNVSVLFVDLVGFTRIVSETRPEILLSELNELFAGFDDILERNGVTRIKTMGDAVMAASGLKNNESGHAISAVRAAFEMHDYLEQRNKSAEMKWHIRIGIHSGSVVGGVIGRNLQFDIWGDTVNIASRMESTSEKGRINISKRTRDLISHDYQCDRRGPIEIKGKGQMEMFFVTRKRNR